MKLKLVGVVGAGLMGRGVAQSLAESGHQVLLVDISDTALERARTTLHKQLRFRGLLAKDAPRETAAAVLGRIDFTTDNRRLSDADFVIENVTERWAVKREVFGLIDTICPAHCIFASNTSAIPITRIASATKRPGQVIGTHFMNPVPLKDTVEVIRGDHTTDETLHATIELLKTMGKQAIVVGDAPGFVSNRVLMLAINEAIFLLQEKVAPAREIDRIFKACLGHTMGPLETADLIGLDTILMSIEVLRESFQSTKYSPCPLLKEMVDAGLHGQKSGRGFYRYPSAE